jgi:Ca2+-binding RTX toxin-like protein
VDLDADGDLDLVVGGFGGKLQPWQNIGTAAAPVFAPLLGSANPFGDINAVFFSLNITPAFVDLDGDGDLDLVVGGRDGTLRAWRNDTALPAITVTVSAENDPATGSVTLAADSAGQLVASAALSDADGLGAITFHWQALGAGVWTDIGATGSFFPDLAQAGQLLRAEARYTDAGGTAEALASTMLARIGSAGADVLSANGSGVVVLFGLDGDDRLSAEESAEAVSLVGGDGNDLYIAPDDNDLLVETPTGGIDTVVATRELTLPENIEVLALSGSAGAIGGFGNAGDNRLNGNDANNHLRGLSGNDRLVGKAGNDTLDGGIGPDTMVGGAGDDLYRVDDPFDVAVEGAGLGTDTVESTVSIKLRPNVEHGLLLGTDALYLRGNADDNGLVGNAGANVVIGYDGADSIEGGDGNDRLRGDGGADSLSGGLGMDTLLGGDGADTLDGGEGRDGLFGGAGADMFRFSAVPVGLDEADGIGDFVPGLDQIGIQRSAFSLDLALGTLEASRFTKNLSGQAVDPGIATFIFETDTARLWWDADGAGGQARLLVAYLQRGLALSESDIVIV